MVHVSGNRKELTFLFKCENVEEYYRMREMMLETGKEKWHWVKDASSSAPQKKRSKLPFKIPYTRRHFEER